MSYYFTIIGTKDNPLFEYEFGTSKAGGDGQARFAEQARHMNQFIVHASLDIVEEVQWASGNMYLKCIDRFYNNHVSCFLTGGNIKFLLLHAPTGSSNVHGPPSSSSAASYAPAPGPTLTHTPVSAPPPPSSLSSSSATTTAGAATPAASTPSLASTTTTSSTLRGPSSITSFPPPAPASTSTSSSAIGANPTSAATEEAIRLFFTDVYEVWVKTLMNPFYLLNMEVRSPVFRARVAAAGKKYL
ncbi:MAG: TRAPP subunit [Phylliscum demangeonii]|nr:MAG: TRAPP subunit [Phylliscum demangeonii]